MKSNLPTPPDIAPAPTIAEMQAAAKVCQQLDNHLKDKIQHTHNLTPKMITQTYDRCIQLRGSAETLTQVSQTLSKK